MYKTAPQTRSLMGRSLVLIAVLACTSVVGFAQALASERDQIYLLQQATGDAGDARSHRYDLVPLGTVAGARRAAVPEIGGHILVLTEEGRVWSWGDNRSAQLGIGSTAAQEGWVAVESLSDVSLSPQAQVTQSR